MFSSMFVRMYLCLFDPGHIYSYSFHILASFHDVAVATEKMFYLVQMHNKLITNGLLIITILMKYFQPYGHH